MKFRVTMKDPDTLGDAINEACKEEVSRIPGLDDEERDVVIEERRGKVAALCGQWFEYGEYLCVEVDTEAGTCVVVPNKR